MNASQQKAEAAQRKREYFRQFKRICDLIHSELFGTFTQVQLEVLYQLRGMSVKIIPDGNVSKEVMDFANEYAQLAQRDQTIPLLEEDGPKVNIREYHQIILPVEILLAPVREGDYEPNIATLVGRPWFVKYTEMFEPRTHAYYDAMDHLRSSIRSFMSDLRFMIFYVDCAIQTQSPQHSDRRIRPEISICPYRPERRKIKLANGAVRSGIRYVIASPHQKEPEENRFIPVSILASKLGFSGRFGEKKLDLYVTEHALNRIDERTSEVGKGYVQLWIMSSFLNAEDRQIVRMKDNRMLVEYRMYGCKIGYVVASIHNDLILVRTFLLMTSNITPEGKILHEHLGLQKLDHQYLGIDKLDTFLYSDILDNEDICTLFRNAGCGSLLELCQKVKDDSVWMDEEEDYVQHDEEQIKLAARMREYLSKGNPEDWGLPEDDELSAESELSSEEIELPADLPEAPDSEQTVES
ncbi:MAG: hypothetical protein LBT76_04925 [Tannerella sp.]|nr:hypothetical protein [Tannerella sp.]